MIYLRKVLFAIPTLVFLILSLIYLQLVLTDPTLILALDLNSLLNFFYPSLFLLLTSIFFIIFLTLASDLKITLPISFLISLSPLLFFNPLLNIILVLGVFISFLTVSLLLKAPLSSYLTFKPNELLPPSIKNLTTLLILTASIGFYLNSQEYFKDGFKLPDSLVGQILSFSMPQENSTATPALPQISSEQLELLKQNPELLKQYGLDPKILDERDESQDIYKSLVQKQLDSLIEPYQDFLPAIFSLLFFITLKSLTSLLSIFVSPLLWLIFLILNKTGFTKYETEMREVKKLVV